MSKAKLAVTTSVAQEVKLDTRTKAQLRVKLFEYASLAKQIKELKSQQDALKTDAQSIFESADELDALLDGASIDGFKVKLVCGKRKVFNRKKFVKKGGDLKLFDACQDEVDNKPYVKITPPGEDNED